MTASYFRPKHLISGLILLLLLPSYSQAQKARSYYEELYRAGGLDRIADLYACFDDDANNENFFIFGKSDLLRDVFSEHGGMTKLPKEMQAQLKRGFLNTRGYSKGVPFADEDFYYKDGDSWVTDRFFFDITTPGRMRLNIVWQTLRYKRSVEILNASGSLKKVTVAHGRCEVIPSLIPQKAD